MVVRVLAHNPLFSLAYRLITSHCYLNESKETGFTYGMQVMVEILQPRNSQSLSSSLFLCLVRETGNEVGKDLDIRHRFTFTPNGKREFVPRDQVFPLFFVYCLLLLHKNK